MKIISWNVNGIRACLNKGFKDFIYSNDPDIVCIQETKANEDQVDLNLPEYKQYWNSAERKGYSGTLLLSKKISKILITELGLISMIKRAG